MTMIMEMIMIIIILKAKKKQLLQSYLLNQNADL